MKMTAVGIACGVICGLCYGLGILIGFYAATHQYSKEQESISYKCDCNVEKEKNAKRRELNSNSGATEEQWKRWKEKGLSSH